MAGSTTPVTWYLHQGNAPNTPPRRKVRRKVGIPGTLKLDEDAGQSISPKSTKLAVELQKAVQEGVQQQQPKLYQPPLDFNRSIGKPVMTRRDYESSAERDVLSQPALLRVLKRATTKLVYVCRHGSLPSTDERERVGLLSRRKRPTPPPGRPKSLRSVVLMTVEQYRWMQRARFVNDTVDQLSLALSSITGTVPEGISANPNIIPTFNAVSAFSDHIALMSTTSNDPQQAALDDRALLYLQQLLVEQGLTIAPTPESQTQQLVHPDMTRRATRFLVKLYKLRKAVSRATKARRLANHDAILIQANILLDEFLMTHDLEGEQEFRHSSKGSDLTDKHRKQSLVQHVLGDHLGELCTNKQTLILHVEANYTRKTTNWGMCCPETIMAGAQIQVNFLIDMTKHSESKGTQYAGMFLVHGKPKRISVMDDYYESFNILAARSLWNTTRNNVDTPLAAAAPVETDRVMLGETATAHERPSGGTSPVIRKKKVVKQRGTSDDETDKKKSESIHSVLSMSSASGSRKGTRPEEKPRAVSAGPRDGMQHSRRGSREGEVEDRLNKSRRAVSAGRGEDLQRGPRRGSEEGRATKKRDSTDPSGHAERRPQRKVVSGKDTPSQSNKKLPKKTPVAAEGNVKLDPKRRQSGDTSPSFYSGDLTEEGEEFYEEIVEDDEFEEELKVIDEEEEIEIIEDDEDVEVKLLASDIIPEIEKLGKLGEEVADILRSPSKHQSRTRVDDHSSVSTDSQPIKLRPKRPPSAEESVGESVQVFQPPGDKIPSMSMRASDFNQPATPTTAAYTSTTASTTLTTVGGSSSGSTSHRKASSSESYEKSKGSPRATLRRTAQEAKKAKAATAGRTGADPPAFRAPSQREQIDRQKKDTEEKEKDSSNSPRKSNKKDSV